jgi:hypothetical protein
MGCVVLHCAEPPTLTEREMRICLMLSNTGRTIVMCYPIQLKQTSQQANSYSKPVQLQCDLLMGRDFMLLLLHVALDHSHREGWFNIEVLYLRIYSRGTLFALEP